MDTSRRGDESRTARRQISHPPLRLAPYPRRVKEEQVCLEARRDPTAS
jgi:hypothetical protein